MLYRKCLKMKAVSKYFWISTLGLVLSIIYVSFGVFLCLTIIGIPIALKYFDLSGLAINPSNKRIKVNYAYNTILNTIWFIFLGGFIFFVLQVLFGLLSMITIIGFNAGKNIIKGSLAVAFPFGMEITDTKKEFDYVPYENEKYKGRKKIKSLIVLGILIIVLSVATIGLLGFGIYTLLEEKNYFDRITDFNSFVETIRIAIENNGASIISKNKFFTMMVLGCILLYLFIDLGVVLLRIGLRGKAIKKRQSFSSRFNSNPEERIHIRSNEARHDVRPEYKASNPKREVVAPKVVQEMPKSENAFMNQKDTNDFGFDDPLFEKKTLKEDKKEEFKIEEQVKNVEPVFDEPVILDVKESEQEEIDTFVASDDSGLVIPEDNFDSI